MNIYQKPTNLDDVILLMENIIQECITTRNKAGYFIAMYYTVTCKIRETINNKEFINNDFIHTLAVNFANFYLEAWFNNKYNLTNSSSWDITFKSKNIDIILQHILLGMNAHINFDLGIATYQTCKTLNINIDSIYNDFIHINMILESMSYKVITNLNKLSPLISLLGLHKKRGLMLVDFTIEKARDGAWKFTKELNDEYYLAKIKERDIKITNLGKKIIDVPLLAKITLNLIKIFEKKNISKNIKEIKS